MKMKFVLLAAFAAVLTAIPAVPAQADVVHGNDPAPGVGNVTGGDVTPEGAAPAMTLQAKDKVAATMSWNAAMKAGDTAGAAKATDAYTAKWGGAGAGSQPKSMSVAAANPVTRVLGVVQVGQNTGIYCGPAAGYEIIRYLHGAGFTSRYDGSAPGQAGLANLKHMATDARGSTNWAPYPGETTGRFVIGVNRWRGTNWYVQVPAPSASLLTGVFTNSIGYNGMPFSGDTVEFLNGAHYNGHPNKLIGHWITAYGYASSGATGYWADSSTTVWSTVHPTFSYNSSSFSSFLRSNGIAY